MDNQSTIQDHHGISPGSSEKVASSNHSAARVAKGRFSSSKIWRFVSEPHHDTVHPRHSQTSKHGQEAVDDPQQEWDSLGGWEIYGRSYFDTELGELRWSLPAKWE